VVCFDILSIFPEMFESPLNSSILKKAQEKGLIQINLHNIRNHAKGKHRITDDAPYGGGVGMVMKIEPIDRALSSLSYCHDKEHTVVILLTPQGQTFNQKIAEELSGYSHIVLICGHYEGIDERVRLHLVDREISIGDYILMGGEISAMAMVEAVSRLVPGVLGNCASSISDSFSMGLLEYPQYTRPAKYKGWKVPDVLLSGHHQEIEDWRREEALKRTFHRRPDLLEKTTLLKEDKQKLKKLLTEKMS
jgi:tRNA (guanine37-N1)-methyltransferase